MKKSNKSRLERVPFDWDTVEGKRDIVFKIVQWLRDPKNSGRISEYRDCTKTRSITEEIIGTPLPAKAEIYCLRQGDEALGPVHKEYASLVVEIPPDDTDDPIEILRYACTYNLWVGFKPLRKGKRRKKASSSRSK